MATYKHIRSNVDSKRPTTSLADGQIAINTNIASPGVFFKDSAGTGIVKVGPVHVGTTAPNSTPGVGGSTGNSKGEQWLDTSLTPAQLKVWNGSAWVGVVADELPVSKLQNGSAYQLLQTDAAGTGVEWASNIDVPGSLNVTSTAVFDSTVSHPLGSAAAPTITFTGDANTGIYSPGIDQVAITTGGTGRLYINSSGRVGIGTTSPDSRFHVVGSTGDSVPARISNNATLCTIGFETSTAANSYSVRCGGSGANDFVIYTDNAEKLRVDSSGNVGIGTSSPSGRLHVNGPANDESRISITTPTNTLTRIGYFGLTRFGVDMQNGFQIRDANSSYATRFLIDSSGNVGIGTSSPSDTLHLNDSVGYGLKITDSSSHIAVYRTHSDGAILKTASNHPLLFGTNDIERMRIDSSGRLLIGTTSARTNFYGSLSSNLQIEGSSFAASSVYATNGNGAFILGRSNAISGSTVGNLTWQIDDGLSFKQTASISGAVDGTPGNNDTPGRIVFSTTADGASSPTERMRIDSTGRMLIGTTTAPGFAQADDFTVSRSTDAGITIRSGTAHSATLAFSDGTGGGASEYRGLIQYSHLSNSLAFSTNSAERLRIDSSGNVKIGGTLPSAPNISLNANGSAQFAGYLRNDRFTTKAGISLSLGGTDYAFAAYQDSLNPLATIGIDGSATFAGNVGIGVTNMDSPLEVAGTGPSLVTIHHSDGGTGDEARLILGALSGSQPDIRGAGIAAVNNGAGHDLTVKCSASHSTGPTEKMRITSGGNVGIGTSSPSGPLDVVSNSAAFAVRVRNRSNDDYGFLAFRSHNGSEDLAQIGVHRTGANTAKLFFYTSGFERMQIDSSGNVGIGTSSPTHQLTVHNASTTAGTIEANRFSARDNYGNASGLGNGIFSPAANTLAFATNSTERMRINSSGKVGIGTDGSQSAERLQVRTSNDIQNQGYAIACQTSTTNTSYQMRFINPNGAVGSITTAAVATSFNTSSDYRLKENIVGLPEAITRVKQLQPKRFNFIVDPDTTVDGFLAHEAQTVVPEAITGTKDAVDDEGKPVYQGIDQSKLVPLLTAALQEAITKIETLEQRLTDAGL